MNQNSPSEWYWLC